MVDALLDAARSLGTRWFHRFGLHCATHQIRIILISCVVITSLFYPALALYSSSSHNRSPSTPRLLAFLEGTASPRIHHPQDDLDDVWSLQPSLLIRDDALSRARCGIERTLRVERILIHSPSPPSHTALTHHTLFTTLLLERHIQNHLSLSSTPCLRYPPSPIKSSKPPPCLVLSPLSFWQHDQQAILSDPHIHNTLSPSHNISLPGGLTLTPNMVLAGRVSRPNSEPWQSQSSPDATYLALTFFFLETDCLGMTHRSQWLQILDSAVKATELDEKTEFSKLKRIQVNVQTREPTLIALEYAPNFSRTLTNPFSLSAIPAFLTLAYAIFFLYVALSMRRMTAVHSRIGLTFTALVEITVSTITSLSVCALVGFRVTLVPWELLPIVIVFVGAENMFNLVDAVSKTSVTLPVKERIALGLSYAGTSNTLKVVSYNSILGTLAALSPAGSATSPSAGAVRQFCVFAIVVLVAHWFLAHTFFMAVLSIDIQRLELEELIRQNPSLTPAAPSRPQSTPTTLSLPRWRKLIIGTQNILRGRATKNISLFLLLAITATLYYTTYPPTLPLIVDPDSHVHLESPSPPPLPLSQLQRADNTEVPAAWHVWKLLNPNEDPLVHLRIEEPTVLALLRGSASTPSPQSQGHDRSQNRNPRFPSLAGLNRLGRRALWACYIVVFPIAITTALLYCLLLYLLKNAELLEAQRYRADATDVGTGTRSVEDEVRLCSLSGSLSGGVGESVRRSEKCMRFWTLGRVMASDVEMMAASEGGRVVVGVSTQDEVFVWRVGDGGGGEKGKGKGKMVLGVDVTDVLLHQRRTPNGSGSLGPPSPSMITAVAVSANGDMCAVGTGAGVIAVWTIGGDAARPLGSHLVPHNSSLAGAVVDLHFLDGAQTEGTVGVFVGAGSRRSFPGEFTKSESRAFGLLAMYENRQAAMWTVDRSGNHFDQLNLLPHLKSAQQQHQQAKLTILPPSRQGIVIKNMAMQIQDERYIIAYAMQDGTVDIMEVSNRIGTDAASTSKAAPLTLGCTLQGGTPADPVMHVHACLVDVGGRARLVVGVATVAGVVSMWDGVSGECISTFDEAFAGLEGGVGLSRMRVFPVAAGSGSGDRRTCRVCRERLVEGFAVVLSVGDVVLVYRAYVVGVGAGGVGKAGTTRRCVCLRNQPGNGATTGVRDAFGLRSRSRSTSAVGLTSSSSSTSLSSLSKRGKLSQAISDPSPFPVSGHGVHSRRASEKDSMMRRASEVLAVPLPIPLEEQHLLQMRVQQQVDGASIWQDVVVVRTGHMSCEKGAWGVVGESVVGVRRRSGKNGRISSTTNRQLPHSKQSQAGLTDATLERWEVWTFDPLTSGYTSYPLGSVLVSDQSARSKKTSPTGFASSSSSSTTTPADITPRLPFTRVSTFLVSGNCAVVGLGNTVGVFACGPS